MPCSSFFFFNDTATTEIYTFPYTTLFRSGGGEDLDVEPLEQRPRPELKGAEPLCDRVVDRSGSLPRERSEEHTSELQSLAYLVCRLLLEKKKNNRSHPGVVVRTADTCSTT